MSWYRQIKTLYSSTYVLMIYIIWTMLTCTFLANEVSFNLYLITLFNVFLMEYLYDKEYKKHITLSVPIIIGAVILWVMYYDLYKAVLNYLFFITSIIAVYKEEPNQINYYEYKQKWISGAYLMVGVALFILIFSSPLLEKMFRVLVMYLILVVINLRESLRYSYNIRSKHSKYINLGIIGFMVIIFQEHTYKMFSTITRAIYGGITYVLNIIFNIIITIVSYPIAYGAELLGKLFAIRAMKAKSVFEGFDKLKIPAELLFQQDTYRDEASIAYVAILLKIFLAAAILIIIVRSLSALVKVEKREEGYVEFKEKLINKKKNKEGIFQKLKKTIFRKRGNLREEILYSYSEFEKVTEKVEIFKPYMTASQLKNVTKIKVDNVDKLDEMTDIYNKAKFSRGELKDENLETVKRAVQNIKSQL
ncbi:hypothetical protein J2Z44_001790 [Clostridium punense]|uniref:DUF4129 domain-containing protein n=1 Tax=Clostridium punense TaxID=1054297 RepID=A0ABS4K2H7_9CLOT|nr:MULTISPECIES: hypothetical protein [Clostridium]EQB89379.1 hypothetical protein M918_20570 [Clostridium sp. BL8]MBP2021989.1 hypothetical protein [Clostridium punense]